MVTFRRLNHAAIVVAHKAHHLDQVTEKRVRGRRLKQGFAREDVGVIIALHGGVKEEGQRGLKEGVFPEY